MVAMAALRVQALFGKGAKAAPKKAAKAGERGQAARAGAAPAPPPSLLAGPNRAPCAFVETDAALCRPAGPSPARPRRRPLSASPRCARSRLPPGPQPPPPRCRRAAPASPAAGWAPTARTLTCPSGTAPTACCTCPVSAAPRGGGGGGGGAARRLEGVGASPLPVLRAAPQHFSSSFGWAASRRSRPRWLGPKPAGRPPHLCPPLLACPSPLQAACWRATRSTPC